MDQQIGFFRRVALAFVTFFAVLFNRSFALTVYRIRREPHGLPLPKPELPTGKEDGLFERKDALHVLAVLQREGRFVDFLQEDLTAFSDAEVGAAARAVHEGCRRTFASYLTLEPVYGDPEGASIVVEQGFNPAAVRLTGNVVGSPPFKGSLRHHGWRVTGMKLPRPPEGQDPAILAPAEVELT